MIEIVHDCYLTIVKKQGHEERLKSSHVFLLRKSCEFDMLQYLDHLDYVISLFVEKHFFFSHSKLTCEFRIPLDGISALG